MPHRRRRTAPGQRHPLSGVGNAVDDERHRGGADQVGDRRGGAQRGGDVARQPEDTAADRDVDDGRGERQRADAANERLVRAEERSWMAGPAS